jgi:hypothetical protein
MADIQSYGLESWFTEDARFYKDVYVYGNINVSGPANFFGPVEFNEDVYFDKGINVSVLTVRNLFDVGVGGTTLKANVDAGKVGIKSTTPINELDVIGVVYVSESIGIGSTNPTNKLDVIGGAYISENIGVGTTNPTNKLDVIGGAYISESVGIGITNPSNTLTVVGSGTSTTQLYVPGISTFKGDIYVLGPLWDKLLSKGTPGQVLLSDSNSVFWGDVSGIGTPLQTIGIYDEGVFRGIVANLNFVDGSDPNNLVNATIGVNTSFANITVSDRWSLSGSDVYRISKVGIGTSLPSSTLDVTGTVHATGAVDFDSTLNVDSTSTLVGQVQVNTGIVPDTDEGAYLGTAALPFSEAHIGEIRIANSTNNNTVDTATGNLNLDAATDLVNVQANLDVDGTLNVDLTSTLVGQVQVNTGIVPDTDEGAYLGTAALPFSDAHIGEVRIANGANNNTVDTATGDLILDAATNSVNVQANLDVDGTLNVDQATTLQTTLQVGTAGTVITTTGIGSVGFGTNAPRRDIQFKEKDVFFDGGAIYDTNENVGFRSEKYQVPRNILTTVGVDTTGSIIGGRFFDAANLIRLNLDFIANETIGFLTSTDYKNPAFKIVNSLGIVTDPVNCKDDIKDILKAITYDITRGGNSRSVGAGLSYYNGNTLVHIGGTDPNNYSVKDATIVAITTAAQIARYVINNVSLPKSYQSIGSSVPQIKDLTLADDPSVGVNTSLSGCANVVSAITVCAGIVTTIIGSGPSASPRTTYPDGKIVWSPAGADSKNIIYVSKYGNDDNNGRTEGAAKLTIGGAAASAQPGDTIMVRSGIYYENNPIGLRTDVTVSGQDLRLVTICPQNDDDVFYVRRGCLIENLSFAYSKNPFNEDAPIQITGAAVAFPPPAGGARSGYLEPGPATEGPTGRWRSPYIRNCTNFMSGSIGMKIDGNHATASTIGNDLKCMVCDSFTQYNENGIGVSITNNGYAQLVSIFTINCDIAIYATSGGSCDLTNSNSSFGNFGLVAVGLGSTEFTGIVSTYPPTRTQPGVDAGGDTVTFANIKDFSNNVRRPYDGQALFFKINLDNYPDAQGTGILQEPMVQVQSIVVTNGGYGFNPATPPTVIIRDASDLSLNPKGPQGIIAEVSPTIDELSGSITAIDVINSGRNYLSTQNLEVFIDGGDLVGAAATVVTQSIYYTVDTATQPTATTGITTVTFNEFIPYELFGGEQVSLKRISRILTSSHSFEYIGTGTSINTATPFQGAVPIKANEIVALDGAQIPFTSTDQKGNFDIGEGFQINQPTATVRGRDFSKAIQAEVTPLILALR